MVENKSATLTCAVTGGILTPTMSPHLPITPQQVERLIGAIRQEHLDHVPFLDCSRPGEEVARF